MNLSKSLCEFFKRNCFRCQKFLLAIQSPLDFQPEVMGIYLPSTGSLAGRPGVGLKLLTPEISLPNFYSPHMDVGTLSLLLLWMDVVSLMPYGSDLYSAQFLTVLSDGCSIFVVIF